MSETPKWRSTSVEDYLKGIYSLQERGEGAATTTALAGRLGVSNSSCSGMVRRLGELGLVQHARYGDIELTPSGLQVALEMVRRHRLLELYLVTALGYSWDEVHDEAEVLEHAVSDTLLDRMARHLGEPALDPHGDPIPTRDGRVVAPESQPLSTLHPGSSGAIVRVLDVDAELLRYLTEHGVALGDRVTVVRREPFGGPVVVRVEGTEVHSFGIEIADAVSVQVDP